MEKYIGPKPKLKIITSSSLYEVLIPCTWVHDTMFTKCDGFSDILYYNFIII